MVAEEVKNIEDEDDVYQKQNEIKHKEGSNG
jgi:hypothetical protein